MTTSTLEQIKQAYERARRESVGRLLPWSELSLEMRLAFVEVHCQGRQDAASEYLDMVQRSQQPLALTAEHAA